MTVFLIYALPLVIAFIASYFIYIILYRRLSNAGNSWPVTISLLVAVASFALIAFVIFYLIVFVAIGFTRGGGRPRHGA